MNNKLQPDDDKYHKLLYCILLSIVLFPCLSLIGFASILPSYSIESAVGAAQINPLKRIPNPATTAYFEDYSLCVAYSPSVFGLKELSPCSALFLMPFSEKVRSSASIDFVGNNLYSEFSFNASGSYSLSKKIHLGASLCHSRLQIKNYNNESLFMFNLGGIIEINEVFSTGFSLSNLNRAAFEGGEKTVDQRAIFGVSIQPDDKIYFDIDMIIMLERSSGIAIAGRYDVLDFASIRLAYLSNPSGFEAGVRINPVDYLSIISEVSYHSFLGFSSDFGISLNL